LTYVKQFDTVRAFAVILVIISHWQVGLITPFNLGSIGVTMFFVLSGFLITQILLRDKKKLESSPIKGNKLGIIGKFTARRALRIFPVYYALLIALYYGRSFFHNPVVQDWQYYALYFQNFLFYIRQSWPDGKLSPMWSLAVEEQFYLFWPWIMVYIPEKHLLKVLIGGFIFGILFQLTMHLFLIKGMFAGLLTPACIDSFCAGGLLSYIIVYKNALNKYYPIIQKIGIVTLILFLASTFMNINMYVPNRTVISIITTWILAKILTNTNKYFDIIMSTNIMMSLGKVSYGLYLFHNFIPTIIAAIIHWVGKHPNTVPYSATFLTFSSNQGFFLLLCVLMLLVITYSSFYLIEKPILRFKKYFD
jgi:peptidoglycan/LPS O-acetylase OafA/YrhL